ncbi:uncharacterized protein MONBRDRAFT_26526 [Monosiga brevicollis MX1]|uniref:Uncharacterized protein n=1 Tax=Monosiga brevicollis TaxID=81824 RepID=A9V2M2_MONBE|nr:uncharacterized protein MONBRDRAFT_26526 [Monosiga brevicollis MX1]EDQ88400.1 predicted protein [Monosiga brevicollis MX1]|eukprot:XP_001746993.1 hypothetical protein [Monosiga brevicollis MX1]
MCTHGQAFWSASPANFTQPYPPVLTLDKGQGKKSRKAQAKAAKAAEDMTQEEKDKLMREAGLASAPLDVKPTQLQQAMDILEKRERRAKGGESAAAVPEPPAAQPDAATTSKKKKSRPAKKQSRSVADATEENVRKSVGQLDVVQIELAVQVASERIRDSAVERLKAMVESLVAQLKDVKSVKSPVSDLPLSACPPDVAALFEEAMKGMDQKEIAAVFRMYLVDAIQRKQQGVTNLPIQLFHQLAIRAVARDKSSHYSVADDALNAVIESFKGAMPQDYVAVPTLWTLNQFIVGGMRMSFLRVFVRFYLLLLSDHCSEKVKMAACQGLDLLFPQGEHKRNIAFCQDVVKQAKNAQLTPKQLIRVILVAYSTAVKRTPEQTKILQHAYPYLRELAVRRSEQMPKCVLELLETLESESANDQDVRLQLCMSINYCATLDPVATLRTIISAMRKFPLGVAVLVELLNTKLWSAKSLSCKRSPSLWLHAMGTLQTQAGKVLEGVSKPAQRDAYKRVQAAAEALATRLEPLAQTEKSNVESAKQRRKTSNAITWSLIFALVASLALFFLLSLHLMCRYGQEHGLANKPDFIIAACSEAEAQGVLSKIDEAYLAALPYASQAEEWGKRGWARFLEAAAPMAEPITPYVVPYWQMGLDVVNNELYPRLQAVWVAAEPQLTAAWAKAWECMLSVWHAALPHLQQVRASVIPKIQELWAQAAPHMRAAYTQALDMMSMAAEAMQPWLADILASCRDAWHISYAYAQELLARYQH